MTEYQTHGALAQSLEAEVTRLRAVNAELNGIIEAGIKPNNSLAQAARQALEALEAITSRIERDLEHDHDWAVVERELANEAITALREAMEAAPHPARQPHRTVTYTCPVCAASLEKKA